MAPVKVWLTVALALLGASTTLATDYEEYCADLCYRRGCDLKYKCSIYDGDDDDWKRAYTIQRSYTVLANGQTGRNDDDDDDDWDWKDQDKKRNYYKDCNNDQKKQKQKKHKERQARYKKHARCVADKDDEGPLERRCPGNHKCQNNGHCSLKDDDRKPKCHCKDGCSGTYCENKPPVPPVIPPFVPPVDTPDDTPTSPPPSPPYVPSCATYHCDNGVCQHDANGAPYCTCNGGCTGNHCEIPPPVTTTPDTPSTPVHPPSSVPVPSKPTTDAPGSPPSPVPTQQCPSTHGGCKNSGTCVMVEGDDDDNKKYWYPKCKCPKGCSGDSCEFKHELCNKCSECDSKCSVKKHWWRGKSASCKCSSDNKSYDDKTKSCKRKSKNVKDVHNKIIEGARNHDKNDDNKKGENKSDDKNKNKGGGGSDDKGKNGKGGNKLLRGVDA